MSTNADVAGPDDRRDSESGNVVLRRSIVEIVMGRGWS
jgi:hypothetical protein